MCFFFFFSFANFLKSKPVKRERSVCAASGFRQPSVLGGSELAETVEICLTCLFPHSLLRSPSDRPFCHNKTTRIWSTRFCAFAVCPTCCQTTPGFKGNKLIDFTEKLLNLIEVTWFKSFIFVTSCLCCTCKRFRIRLRPLPFFPLLKA